MFQPGSNTYTNGPGGTNPENSEVPIIADRAPTSNDIRGTNAMNFPIGKRWIWKDNSSYVLFGFTSIGGTLQADWQILETGEEVKSFTVPNGTSPIYPDVSGNITLTSNNGSVTISGDPSSDIDYSVNLSNREKFVLGYGISPVSPDRNGNINLTSVDGSVTITGIDSNTIGFAADLSELQFFGNSGTANPSSNVINILGDVSGTSSSIGIPIGTTESGNTITITGQTAIAASSGNILTNGMATFDITNFSVDSTGFVSLLPNSGAITQVVVRTFINPGTYTPTTGMLYCLVEAVGGGGGGGGAYSSTGNYQTAGGGGGSGGYAAGLYNYATANGAAMTIGAGGTGGDATGSDGGTGGTTTFGSLITCYGGFGGKGSTTDSPAGMSLGGYGGNISGSLKYYSIGDQGKTASWANLGSGNLFVFAGQGANCKFGSGGGNSGISGAQGSANGYNANGNGSGGAGAYVSGTGTIGRVGGTGGAGMIVITEYISA